MKPFLDRDVIAMRAAREINDGECVNLGTGIPSLVTNYISSDVRPVLHSEIGCVNFTHALTEEEVDKINYDYVLAGGNFVLPEPGMAFVDHCISFVVIRGGRLALSVMGARQVSTKGDLANWSSDVRPIAGGIGGSMDLAVGAKRLVITMTHVTRSGEPKIVNECFLPLTAKECVNRIITDAAVIDVTDEGLVLKEVAPGWYPEDVQAITEPHLIIADDLKEMTL
ncbi:CoA-transferase [Chloroflexota bacterium]